MRTLVALLALLVVCGPVVRAQDDEDLDRFAKMFEKIIVGGGLQSILDRVPGGITDLGRSPAALRRIAAAGARVASKYAGAEPQAWTKFVELLQGACKAIPEGEADSTDAKGARAETRLCRVRVDAVMGEPFRKEEWVAIAEFFVGLNQDDPAEGKNLARAARILDEAGRVGGADAADLRKRANDLCVSGAKQFPNNQYFAAARHRAKLAQIEATFDESRSAGKKMLKEYLDSLEDSKAIIDTTCYNDTVTFALENKKYGVRPKYLSEEVRLGILTLDIPRSQHWKKSGQTLYQYDDEDELVRSFHFKEYKWTTNYYLGTKTYGGDNIKGLGRIGEQDVLSVVVDVKQRVKLRRMRLNRAFPSAQMFVIGGFDKDNSYICFRSYYFKAKKTRLRSVCLDILEREPLDDLDPEAEFVVASIRE